MNWYNNSSIAVQLSPQDSFVQGVAGLLCQFCSLREGWHTYFHFLYDVLGSSILSGAVHLVRGARGPQALPAFSHLATFCTHVLYHMLLLTLFVKLTLMVLRSLWGVFRVYESSSRRCWRFISLNCVSKERNNTRSSVPGIPPT